MRKHELDTQDHALRDLIFWTIGEETGEQVVSRNSNAERMRPIALCAAVLLMCLQGALAYGQRPVRQAPAPRPRFAARQQQRAQQRAQKQFNRQYQNGQYRGRPPAGAQQQGPAYRPQAPASGYPNAGYGGGAYARPAYPGTAYPGAANRRGYSHPRYNNPAYAPPGHLQSWLNQHRGLPVQDQERLLRNDPAFARQAPAEQQREMQQLHAVNQMPEQLRERRLARNEMLERLTPEQRMGLSQASRSYATLPPDRRQIMGRAFQDLRSVPLDQRETVLNSARYQGQFSPQERDILSNFLRVEPYEPPQ